MSAAIAMALERQRSLALSSVELTGRVLALATVGAWGIAAVTDFGTGVLILNFVALIAIIFGFKGNMCLFAVTMLSLLDGVTRSTQMTGGLWRYNTFNYALLLLMVLYHQEVIRRIDVHSRLLLFLLVILGLGLLVSSDVESGVQHMLSAATVFGLVAVFRRANFDEVVWFWLAALAGLTTALGCAVYFFGAGGQPTINHNVFALFPLTAIFAHCLAHSAVPPNSRGTTLLMLLSTCNTVWVFLSGSRGALMTAVICVAYLGATLKRKRQLAGYTLAAALVVSVLLAVSPSMTRFAVARVEKLVNEKESIDDRTSGRTELAAIGWQVFTKNPLGIGTGAFAEEFARRNYESKRFQAGTRREAHSAWIKVLAENGLPGILVFTGYVLSFALAGWTHPQRSLRRFGLLTSAALAIAFLSTEFAAKSVWFLAAGCTLLLSSGGVAVAPAAPRRYQVL